MPGSLIGGAAKIGTSLVGGLMGSGPKPSNHPYFGKQAQQLQFGELGRMMNAWGDPTMANYLRGDPTGDFQKMMGQFGGQAPSGRPSGYSPMVENTIGSFGGQMNQAPSDYSQWAQPPMPSPQSRVMQFMQPGNVRFGYGGGNLGGYNSGYSGPLPRGGSLHPQQNWMGA